METPTLMQRVMEARGLDAAALEAIEDGSHAVLDGAWELTDRLRALAASGGPVCVLPDFDMDGVASAAVAYAGLCQIGVVARLFVPTPSEGYGFGAAQVDRILDRFPDTAAILTCDVGITCHEGVDRARERGVQVLVTDHHREGAEKVRADVCVDPWRPEDPYEHKDICGAHVVYQVVELYARRFLGRPEQAAVERLKLVAGLGTVADSMPLLFENRALVKEAVAQLKGLVKLGGADSPVIGGMGCCEQVKGVVKGAVTLAEAFLKAKGWGEEHVDEDLFGFYMAPAVNSLRRVPGKSMEPAYRLFLGEDKDRAACADYLVAANEERKALRDRWVSVLEADPFPLAPWAHVCEAPGGILGLLANAELDPVCGFCCVLAPDGRGGFSGSMRAADWYPALERLQAAGFSCAGHNCAAGISLPDQDAIGRLVSFVWADTQLFRPETFAGPELTLGYGDHVDAPFDLAAWERFAEDCEAMAPWGRGFEFPRTTLEFDGRCAEWRAVGRGGSHLKAVAAGGLDVMIWGRGDMLEALSRSPRVVVEGRLGFNRFRGARTLQYTGDVRAA